MKFNFAFIQLILISIAFNLKVNAIGVGTVASAIGYLFKIVDFVQGIQPVNSKLTNYYKKQWPYHERLTEYQYNPKDSRDIFIFLIARSDSFSPAKHEAFAKNIENMVRTAGDYGLTFKTLLSAIDKVQNDHDWKVTSHTINGGGKLRYMGKPDLGRLCWEGVKWTYVSIGPVENYLFDTSIIQGWHNENEKQRKGNRNCY